MRIFTAEQCPQGSGEWWTARRGLPTASGFSRIMTPAKRKLSAQAADYCAELAADVADLRPNWFSDRENRPPNPWMAHGSAAEPEARRYYELETETTVQQVGFCLSDCRRYGCSPDGLVHRGIGAMTHLDRGLEIKCPQLKTQAGYLLTEKVPLEYLPQCHGQLIVTGLDKIDFLSYAPGLPAMLVTVERNDFTADLQQTLEAFLGLYDATLQRLLGIDLAEMIERFHPEDEYQKIMAELEKR
jgi:hypothetical protein